DRIVELSTLIGTNAGQEVRVWSDSSLTFQGNLAVSGDGAHAYAQASDGRIAILGLHPGEGILQIGLGSTAPREIAASPFGGRFYTVDERGVARIGDDTANIVKENTLVGGFRAIAISPEGEIAYLANFVTNAIEVLNVQANNLTSLSRFTT